MVNLEMDLLFQRVNTFIFETYYQTAPKMSGHLLLALEIVQILTSLTLGFVLFFNFFPV